jgi:hypothetical protein
MYSDYYLENLTLHKASKSNYTKSAVRHLQKYGNDYSFVIAYSIEGIWAVCYHNILHFWKKIPLAYFSMELFDVERKCPWIISCLLSFFNGLNTKMLKFSVIQDAKRAEILKRHFNFVDKIFTLPNSYIGYTHKVSMFAHKKFNISTNKKILLYTGALERWSYDIHLASYLSKLLYEDYVLLLSGFCRDSYVDIILKEYADLIGENKVIVNTEILNELDYTELVKSATIGLVWYKKLETNLHSKIEIENIYSMGLSSGKLCKYLSCSIPVVAPSFYTGYKELMEDKKIGKVSDYGEELADKILTIVSDYALYKYNVENIYKNELEYSKQSQPIINEIKKIG